MNHPFQIGQIYANRRGEYEVVSINHATMAVRYRDGTVQTVDIAIQARIWENMQTTDPPIEQKETHTEARQPVQPRKGRQGTKFTGLVQGDFKDGVKGTSWRARENLGGLLAQSLSDRLGTSFQSWAIYRMAEVYLTYPDRYSNSLKEGPQHAKLAFELSPEGARFGFYIERSDEKVDDNWDWQRFVQRLGQQARELQTVTAAMLKHGVTGDPELVARDLAVNHPGRLVSGTGGLAWHPSDGSGPVASTWADFSQRLASLEQDKWCNLYFYASMSSEEAIKLGVGIVDRVIDTYVGLLPLYTLSLP